MSKRARNNLEHVSLSLLEFGLYSECQGGENTTRIALRDTVTVKVGHLIMGFWLTIRDGVFAVGNTNAKKIRDPRIRSPVLLSVHLVSPSIDPDEPTSPLCSGPGTYLKIPQLHLQLPPSPHHHPL
nr:hypothetical protein [Tanacetum cinerariifolium]